MDGVDKMIIIKTKLFPSRIIVVVWVSSLRRSIIVEKACYCSNRTLQTVQTGAFQLKARTVRPGSAHCQTVQPGESPGGEKLDISPQRDSQQRESQQHSLIDAASDR